MKSSNIKEIDAAFMALTLAKGGLGESVCQEALWAFCETPLKAIFRNRGIATEDLDDCFSRTMQRVFKSAGSFDPRKAKPHSWIYGVAHHVATNWLRDLKSRDRAETVSLESDEYNEPVADPVFNMAEMLPGLLERDLRAAQMLFIEHRSWQEVADALGLRAGYVHTMFTPALRRKIAAELEGAGYGRKVA